MDLTHMFPSKTLAGEDFAAALGGQPVTLTIEGITDKAFESRDRPGEEDIVYYIKFRQLKKPVKLNQSNAWAIADALGTTESNEWLGKNVMVCAYKKSIVVNVGGRPNKKVIWVFDFSPEPAVEPPVALVNTDITGQAMAVRKGLAAPGALLSLPPGGTAPQPPGAAPGLWGEETALKVYANLYRRDKTMDDLRAYVKAMAPQIGPALDVVPPKWPQACLPWARTYCEGIPATKPVPSDADTAAVKASWAPKSEVVDRKTGEVITPGKTDPDDIPF